MQGVLSFRARLTRKLSHPRKEDVPMSFSKNDTEVLRQLASRFRELCDSDENLARRQRWTNLNSLNHSGPPLLLVSPEGSWREIRDTLPVECEDTLARQWEFSLRTKLYQRDVIGDDAAFDAVFSVPRGIQTSDFGVPFKQSSSDSEHGAYHDDPVIDDLAAGLEKLSFRKVTVNRDASQSRFDLASETFNNLLTIEYQGTYWWTCGLTWTAIRLMGLENLMMAMYDDPDGLHRLMKFLSDDMMNYITFFEREELLGYNAGTNMIGSGSLGCTTDLPTREQPAQGPVQLKHLWGFAESQETVGVSPDMFGEFIYPYQQPLQEMFGLNYYGCCEPSEDRWPWISQTPNLRCISVAPWSDQARCAELLGRDFVYCRKPNPSPVCMTFEEDAIRREFQDTLRHAGELNTVMILKDTHTVENQPERFARWVDIGREELEAACAV